MRKAAAKFEIESFARRWAEKKQLEEIYDSHVISCHADLHRERGELLEFRTRGDQWQDLMGWIGRELREKAEFNRRMRIERGLSRP